MYIINWTENGVSKSETYCAYSIAYDEVVNYAKGKADKNTSVTVSSI